MLALADVDLRHLDAASGRPNRGRDLPARVPDPSAWRTAMGDRMASSPAVVEPLHIGGASGSGSAGAVWPSRSCRPAAESAAGRPLSVGPCHACEGLDTARSAVRSWMSASGSGPGLQWSVGGPMSMLIPFSPCGRLRLRVSRHWMGPRSARRSSRVALVLPVRRHGDESWSVTGHERSMMSRSVFGQTAAVTLAPSSGRIDDRSAQAGVAGRTVHADPWSGRAGFYPYGRSRPWSSTR